jgi:hypothetical protein
MSFYETPKMKRKEFLALGAAVTTLASIGCRPSSGRETTRLAQTYLITSDDLPETSYITGYDQGLLEATSTAIEVSGLGFTTCGYARIRDKVFIPISGGNSSPSKKILEFNTETRDTRFISCEYLPADVATLDNYLYVAHDDFSMKSTVSKIRAVDGTTMKKTILDGIATRIFTLPGQVYVFCDRLINPPNANQTIHLLDQDLEIQRTLTHPYSYMCIDVIRQDNDLIIANNQASAGVSGASALITLHIPSGHIHPLAAPPSKPIQFLRNGRILFLACESGEILQIQHNRTYPAKTLKQKSIFRAYIQNNNLFYLESFTGPLYAVDIVSGKVLAKSKVPTPKYQSAALLIFPRHV